MAKLMQGTERALSAAPLPRVSGVTGSDAELLPAPGDWAIDPSGSSVAFSGRASRLAPTVRARFGDVRGVLRLAEDPNRSRVAVRLDVRTLSTGNPVWDDLLRAADPFRAVDHPLAQYVSTSVRWTGGHFRVSGALDLGGVQTPLALSATIRPDGRGAVDLHAEGTIDPRAADIHLNMPGSKLLLPRVMHLMIAVKAIRSHGGADKARRFALAS